MKAKADIPSDVRFNLTKFKGAIGGFCRKNGVKLWRQERETLQNSGGNFMKNATEQQNVGTAELGDDNIEELLQKERDALFKSVFHDYCVSRDISAKEYVELQKQFEQSPKLQYEAIKRFNRKIRLFRGIVKEPYRAGLRLCELFEVIDKLVEAEDEETFNEIYSTIKHN